MTYPSTLGSQLWRKLEAEGRLRWVGSAMKWRPWAPWATCEVEYWQLRLTPDELAYLHGEPCSGEDEGVAEFTNLELLGE